VVSSFVPFHVEGDFGFGRPRLVIPWIRPGRLGSAAITVARSPLEDGSWQITARLWPRLADAVDADPDAVLKPATAARLGFGAPDPAVVMQLGVPHAHVRLRRGVRRACVRCTCSTPDVAREQIRQQDGVKVRVRAAAA